MKELIHKILYWYVDKDRMIAEANLSRFPIGTSVTWNWKARVFLGANKSEHFKVEGYYEEGVETNNGAIADYWLKSITTITHQEQQP